MVSSWPSTMIVGLADSAIMVNDRLAWSAIVVIVDWTLISPVIYMGSNSRKDKIDFNAVDDTVIGATKIWHGARIEKLGVIFVQNF